MFNQCDFVLGSGDSVLVIVPERFPRAETYTVSVCRNEIKFKADYEDFATMPYQGGEVFDRIAQNTQVGIVEYEGSGDFPAHITHVAYVEVRRAG